MGDCEWVEVEGKRSDNCRVFHRMGKTWPQYMIEVCDFSNGAEVFCNRKDNSLFPWKTWGIPVSLLDRVTELWVNSD